MTFTIATSKLDKVLVLSSINAVIWIKWMNMGQYNFL